MEKVIGNCGKHPGQSMINCPLCEIEETKARMREVYIIEEGAAYLAKENDILKRDMLYWKLEALAKDKKLDELGEKLNEMIMADMTHEYNEAEAERFRPEYERQIKEPLEERIKELEGRDGEIAVDKWETFCDSSYYHLWAVRPIGDGNFSSQKLFHVQTKEEAEALKDILNKND